MTSSKLRTALLLITTLVLLLPAHSTRAQKQTANQFPRAIERSEDAGRIVSLLALDESGLPKELIERAEAVAVFPRVTKDVAFISHTTRGFGVISSRTSNGWTAPAFYRFYGDVYGDPFAPNETFAMVLLIMGRDALAWFEEGRVRLAGKRKAVAGLVGTLTDQQRKELAGAQIIGYVYYNGKLSGDKLSGNFFNTFSLNPDNKINKPLYGIKGREVLAGQNVDAAALPAGIPAFPAALQKHFSRP